MSLKLICEKLQGNATMLTSLIDLLFVISVQLVALSCGVLSAYYGPIYVNAAYNQGWGACRTGFIRYARDHFFQSALLFIIFASWSLRLWYGGLPPMSQRFLGEMTMLAVPALFIVTFDLVLHAIREVRWAWVSYLLAGVGIIAANLAWAGALQ